MQIIGDIFHLPEAPKVKSTLPCQMGTGSICSRNLRHAGVVSGLDEGAVVTNGTELDGETASSRCYRSRTRFSSSSILLRRTVLSASAGPGGGCCVPIRESSESQEVRST